MSLTAILQYKDVSFADLANAIEELSHNLEEMTFLLEDRELEVSSLRIQLSQYEETTSETVN